jgi:uncharacterized membrane protein YgcG
MEYITLINQQNLYPSIVNYVTTKPSEITLTGNYNTNKIVFSIDSLSDIVTVKDTKFRFLLSIEGSNKIYTSTLYYNELATSLNESNPYFIDGSFRPEFIVNYTLADISQIVTELKAAEKLKNVTVTKNIFILEDGSYDYQELVKYIDWVVSPVALSDLGNNNVLPLNIISEYSIPEIAKPTNDFSNLPTANEVTQERIQVYKYKFNRRRNLKKEDRSVREFKSATSKQVYVISEDTTFYATTAVGGWHEVYDDSLIGRTGYVQSDTRFSLEQGGPYFVTQTVLKTPPAATPPLSTPSTNPRGGSVGGGSNMGGGGSSYGGGYNGGRDNMDGNNNSRYNQR